MEHFSKSTAFSIFANIVILLCLLSNISCQCSSQYEVYYEWKQVDYNFPNQSYREELIENGGYVQINCIPNAIKVYKDNLFIATPRYKPGVPSTLNVIPYKKSRSNDRTGPILDPFPSLAMQEFGNCSAFQLVQSMELDSFNRLWVLDAGRVDVLTSEPKTVCPAKLVIIDLENRNKIERVYEFPDDVAPRDSNAIKDMQVACTSRNDCISYISNINVTCSLIVYDYKKNDSWYGTHPIMQPDLTKASVTIDGVTAITPFGITGLGLSPKATNHSYLFFSKIAGDHIYRLPTSVMKDGDSLKRNPNIPPGVIEDLGQKPSGQADGTAMDNKGNWFFGSLPNSEVHRTNTNQISLIGPQRQTCVARSEREMQWPDLFSFDGKGYLLFTTNKFQRYPSSQIDPQDINFRIIRLRTFTVSYQF